MDRTRPVNRVIPFFLRAVAFLVKLAAAHATINYLEQIKHLFLSVVVTFFHVKCIEPAIYSGQVYVGVVPFVIIILVKSMRLCVGTRSELSIAARERSALKDVVGHITRMMFSRLIVTFPRPDTSRMARHSCVQGGMLKKRDERNRRR